MLALLPAAPTVALDVETVAEGVAAHSWDYDSGTCMCGTQGGDHHVALVIVAADPRRTEAAVKAEALREVLDEDLHETATIFVSAHSDACEMWDCIRVLVEQRIERVERGDA